MSKGMWCYMLIGDTVGAVAGRAWGGIRFKSARERKEQHVLCSYASFAFDGDASGRTGRRTAKRR